MNQVIECLKERRSCRSFLPEQVPEDKLQAILEAGMYAATGKGKQAAKIVVVQNPEDIATLEHMNAEILGAPDAHPFFGAPTVCVVLTDPNNYTGVEDASLVMGNLMNAAHSLGIGSCWIHRARQEFDSPEGKALLKKWGVEGEYVGVGHCILGIPDGPCKPAAPRKADYVTRV